MKKIMFIGAGEFQKQGIIQAKKMGYYVLATDGNKNAIGKNYADEFYHIDIKDINNSFALAKQKEVNGICSIASEAAVETVSYISDKLKLKGNSLEIARLCHDKQLYYAFLYEKGIKVPESLTFEEYRRIQLDAEYVIVKPSKGSGSRLVETLHRDDVDYYIKENKSNLVEDETFIIQRVVSGKEITVDGFVIDNQPYILAISEEKCDINFSTNVSVELEFPPQWMDKKLQTEIINTSIAISKILGITFGPFHIEYILTKDNQLNMIDFALRGGGFRLFTDIVEKTSGVNIINTYILGIMGEEIHLIQPHEFDAVILKFLYTNQSGIIKEIKGIPLEGQSKNYILGFLKQKGDYVQKPKSGQDRLAYIISWGNHMKEVKKKVNSLQNEIKFYIE